MEYAAIGRHMPEEFTEFIEETNEKASEDLMRKQQR